MIARPKGLAESASFVAHDGLAVAYSHVSGALPGILAVHATGFCKEVWGPVAADGLDGRAVACIDQRGHGDSQEPPIPFDWWDIGRDCITLIDHLGWSGTIGVGHSSGGTALVMAEVLRPGTFAGLVLIEPIMGSEPAVRSEGSRLAEIAQRRRSTFSTPTEALEAYRGRGLFARWDDRALESFIAGGLRRVSDGSWVLKCRPAFEAECYRSGAVHGVGDRLGEVACRVVVMAGSESSTHGRVLAQAHADAMPNAQVLVIEGATHFVPMEMPRVVASAVEHVAAG